MWSIIAGGLFGIFFDMLCGAVGVHSYLLPGETTPTLCACGLAFLPLLINGILSYGIAMWTSYYITKPALHTAYKQITLLVPLYLLVICFSVLTVVNGETGTLVILFACGFAIVAMGELLMLAQQKAGPLSTALITRQAKELACTWVLAIGIAIVYETTNYFFPFWVWFPSQADVGVGTEVTIIIFAYAGLFHPMVIFWQTLKSRTA